MDGSGTIDPAALTGTQSPVCSTAILQDIPCLRLCACLLLPCRRRAVVALSVCCVSGGSELTMISGLSVNASQNSGSSITPRGVKRDRSPEDYSGNIGADDGEYMIRRRPLVTSA